MDSTWDRLALLADSWSTADDGLVHVVACQDFGCKTCVVIACATDLRAALRDERLGALRGER